MSATGSGPPPGRRGVPPDSVEAPTAAAPPVARPPATPPAAAGGRERASRDTRRALLDAGWRIFERLGWEDLLRAIRVREVASEAGVTTGAFVHHFSTTERFFAALAEDARDRLLQENDDLFDQLDHTGDALQGIDVAVDRDFTGPGLEVARRALLAMVVADDPQSPVGKMVQQYHARTDAALLTRLRDWLQAMDREPLPPFTVADIGVVFRAVADGLRIRRAATPNAVDASLAGSVLLVLTQALTRPRSSGVDLLDLTGRLRPARRSGSGGVDGPAGTEPDAAFTARVLAAGRRAFTDRRLDEVSLETIAADAEVPVERLTTRFGWPGAVAGACFLHGLDERLATQVAGHDGHEDPADLLEAITLTLVREARRAPTLTTGFLDTLFQDMAGRPMPPALDELREERVVMRHVVPITRTLREQGRLRPRIDSETLAWTLLQTALMRALARPHDPDERVVDDACDLLLHGVLADPDAT